MSYEAWGDDDDGMDGYVTEERALEWVQEALQETAAEWSTVLLALSAAREYPDFDEGQSQITVYLDEAIAIAEKRLAALHSAKP